MNNTPPRLPRWLRILLMLLGIVMLVISQGEVSRFVYQGY